jgi:hypothetical protein
MNRFLVSVVALASMLGGTAAHAALLGPSGGTGLSGEYASFADSPFSGLDFSAGYFFLEDFEDGLQNTAGLTADTGGVTSVVFGPTLHDSVDLDDGTLDGSGLAGDSWFSSIGSAGVTWTFNETVLGALPTHAGLVWTDGGGTITFEAFDASGNSLGTVVGGHATGGSGGQTDEDRFYGVTEAGGISAIKISNSSGGIELDHVQYGNPSVDQPTAIAEPGGLAVLGLAMAGLGLLRRRRAA